MRIYEKGGTYVETAKTGRWGICGPICFSISEARIERSGKVPLDHADGGCYDAYEIARLTADVFEYKHVTT